MSVLLAPARGEGAAQGRALARVRLADEPDPGGPRHEPLDQLHGSVAGAVVADHHLDLRVGLGEGAPDRPAEVLLVLVVGDEQGDERLPGEGLQSDRPGTALVRGQARHPK